MESSIKIAKMRKRARLSIKKHCKSLIKKAKHWEIQFWLNKFMVTLICTEFMTSQLYTIKTNYIISSVFTKRMRHLTRITKIVKTKIAKEVISK